MKLFKFITLAKKRLIGNKEGNYTNYLNFQEFQAKEIIREINNKGINLSHMKVLELGAGEGGYSLIFKKFSKEFITTDLEEPYILKLDSSLNFKKVDVTKKYPFEDNSFDFIFSCSLIEHIKSPEEMLVEIKRVLNPGGYLYLSFPPFYSPVGGHGLKPFHLLGEKISIKMTNFFKKRDIKSYDTLYVNFGLYKRTIKGVKKLLLQQGFEVEDIWTRFFSINTAKIPFLGEFLTWHVCFLCKNKK